jgi:2-polyprenyl-3-methyl-5-hydroxy-6-metoxy-1,4-benzoquinol methylase
MVASELRSSTGSPTGSSNSSSDSSSTGSSTVDRPTSRAAREALSYDEDDLWSTTHRWHERVMHVLTGPNTLAGERRFDSLLAARARGGRVLDVGCGRGSLTRHLHALGAASVYGFDISEHEIERARVECRGLDGVSFAVQGAEAPLEGRFELIAGRSILHHIDFREVVPRLYEHNLEPGGRMIFMEPFSHPLTLAFHKLVRSAHTSDEWPLTAADVVWLRRRFAARVLPVNLLSFPAGIVSSLLLKRPDNLLMRAADALDRSLERRPFFQARGRQGIVVIERP